MAGLRESYGRCLFGGGFFDSFYTLLFQADARVPKLFARTDLAKQKEALRSALATLVMYDRGSSVAQATLERLAVRHRELEIPADLYQKWEDCLIRAVQECDPKFDLEVEEAWRSVTRLAVEEISEGAGPG